MHTSFYILYSIYTYFHVYEARMDGTWRITTPISPASKLGCSNQSQVVI